MKPFQEVVTAHNGPESKVQKAIIAYLRTREWMVKETHGNQFQKGFPDLFATHKQYRARWIEVKVAENFSFTTAQVREYPLFNANGSPIWILTGDTDEEYAKLFKPTNLHEYLVCYENGCRNIINWRAGKR